MRPAAVPPAAAVLNKGCTGSQTRYCTTSTPRASMRTVFPAVSSEQSAFISIFPTSQRGEDRDSLVLLLPEAGCLSEGMRGL